MPTIKATEMTDASVDFISLVKRGANRIPFRVLKSDTPKETPMINLNDLGTAISRALKGESAPVGPTVVGVATVAKEGPQLEAVKKSLEANGYKIDDAQVLEDGTTVFKQNGELPAEHQIVRLSENVALVMKSFVPYADDLTNDFLASVKAKGFYSSVRSATETFCDALYELMYDSASSAEASTSANKLLGDFQTYVKGLITDLPTKAFKLEKEIDEAVAVVRKSEADGAGVPFNEKRPEQPGGLTGKNADGTPELTEPNSTAPKVVTTLDADGNAVKNTDPVAADVPAPAVVEERREDVSPGQSQEQAAPTVPPVEGEGGDKVQKSESVELAAVLKGLSALTEIVQKSEAGRADFEQKLNERVDGIARKSEDALKAVKTTVVGAPEGEDAPSHQGLARKTEDDDPRTGLFDTAFLPKARR